MLAIDVSRSMTATDVSPSRLASAVAAAKKFVAGVPSGFRVGLVAFDDTARVVTSPTPDHGIVVDALDQLQPGRGTAAGDAIEASLGAIRASLGSTDSTNGSAQQDLTATIVLLSDGATTSGEDPSEAAKHAGSDGVPVTTIAYGTDHGTVEIEGEIVPVPADPEAMRAIANATSGSFFEAASATQLRAVYDDIQGRVGYTVEQREVVLWFVTAALLALMASLAAAMFWTARFV